MPIKLIIFDLDGTLVDSIEDLTAAVNHARGRFGRTPLPVAEVRELIGQGARKLIEQALPDAAEEEVREALTLFLEWNLNHLVERTRPYPGVPEVLDRLRLDGKKLAVVTNKNEALTVEMLKLLGLDHFFDAVVGADTLPFRKPSPEPLLHLLEKFSLEKEEAMMVGDSIYDIAAGKAAGLVTIGCSFGYGKPEELKDADAVVGSFDGLLALPLLR